MNFKKIKNDLYANKEGILGGSVVGLATAFYAKSAGLITQSLITMSVESPGLIDQFMSLPAAEMTFLKMCLLYAMIGAIIGYFIDKKIMPRK